MALSATNLHLDYDDNVGARTLIRHPEFTCGTYATSGVGSIKALTGFTQVNNVFFTPMTSGSYAYIPYYDFANDLVVIYTSGSEVSNSTDLSAIKFRATVFGF